jgi:hypothetical protein
VQLTNELSKAKAGEIAISQAEKDIPVAVAFTLIGERNIYSFGTLQGLLIIITQ